MGWWKSLVLSTTGKCLFKLILLLFLRIDNRVLILYDKERIHENHFKDCFCYYSPLFNHRNNLCPRCKRRFLFRNEQNLLRSLDRLGDCINFSPTITNTGNIEGYVYFRLEQPVVIGESDTPLYTLDINNSWELRKEHILENKLISIYAYKDPLKPRQSTDPLCSQIQISQISIS